MPICPRRSGATEFRASPDHDTTGLYWSPAICEIQKGLSPRDSGGGPITPTTLPTGSGGLRTSRPINQEVALHSQDTGAVVERAQAAALATWGRFQRKREQAGALQALGEFGGAIWSRGSAWTTAAGRCCGTWAGVEPGPSLNGYRRARGDRALPRPNGWNGFHVNLVWLADLSVGGRFATEPCETCASGMRPIPAWVAEVQPVDL